MYPVIIEALWFILPAYIANSMPVNVSKIDFLKKYGKPIDSGKCINGVRILGDGKTWRGLIFGVSAGTLIGLIQRMFQKQASVSLESIFHLHTLNLPPMSVELAFMLSVGTMVGDMLASFVKRQSGLKPGNPAPLLDQLDFVFGAFFFAWLLKGSIASDYFIIILIVTPAIHIFGNFVAWIWKLKKEPW